MGRLVLIGGPIGVGKTTVMKHLETRCKKAGFLDADDVFRVSPDLSAIENRHIAHRHVIEILRGYFAAGCEIVFLSWVFARPALYEPVFDGLRDLAPDPILIHLIASEARLAERLAARGDQLRERQGMFYDEAAALEYSLSRLALINALAFPKIDTSHLSSVQVADEILSLLEI